jgi:CMP/dCMP kinase
MREIQRRYESFFIIAVDGPAASGKGTLARRLADQFHLSYLDTGAIYRAAAKRILDEGRNPDDPEAAVSAAIYVRDHLSWEMLDDPRIRTDEVADATSRSSVFPAVRDTLLEIQRFYAHHPIKRPGHTAYQGAVLDGRDIGTVVCPDADMKLYVTASVDIRAERRLKELQNKGVLTSYNEVLADMQERDARDSGRSAAPLKPAKDAIIIDTSEMSADAAFEHAVNLVRERLV